MPTQKPLLAFKGKRGVGEKLKTPRNSVFLIVRLLGSFTTHLFPPFPPPLFFGGTKTSKIKKVEI